MTTYYLGNDTIVPSIDVSSLFVAVCYPTIDGPLCNTFTNLKKAVQFAYDNRHKWNIDLEAEIQIQKLYKEHCEDNYV